MTSVAQTHYLVYAITNTINNKIYIGCHKTKNPYDNYMGSGKYLKRAQNKYRIENFSKEVLLDFGSPGEMYQAEVQLISDLKPEYNLHKGGFGGWEYVNTNKMNVPVDQQNNRGKYASLKHQELKRNRIESYNLAPRFCNFCRKSISYEKRANKFCSHSCAAKRNNSKRISSGWKLTRESRERIANTLAATQGYVYRRCPCGKKVKSSSRSGMCLACYLEKKKPGCVTKGNIEEWKRRRLSGESSRSIAKDFNTNHGIVLRYTK